MPPVKFLIGNPKKCPRCGLVFVYNDLNFAVDKNRISGLSPYCLSCSKERSRKWKECHTESVREHQRKCHQERKVNGKHSLYEKKRRKEDVRYRVIRNIRGRFRSLLNQDYGVKDDCLFDICGCTRSFLLSYIESLWEDGMSWDNYGFYGWHIDHIKPCASFDMADPSQQKQCFNYTNLQPLWMEENLRKGGRY